MKKIKIVEIITNGYYDNFDDYVYDCRVTSNIDWEEISEEVYEEVAEGLKLLNRRSGKNKKYAILSIPDQKEIIDFSVKTIREAVKKEKEKEEKRKKEQEALKAKKEAASQERKLKQLQKLQKELGIVNENN